MSRTIALLALALPAALAAQDRVTSTFVVTQAGRETGKERLTLQAGDSGHVVKLTVAARTLTGRDAEAVVTRASDGDFDTMQIEFRDGSGTEIVRAGHRGNRVIVTVSGPAGRRTRELPADDHPVLLDEELHALLFAAADLATPAGRPLVALYVRSGRRVAFTATRRSMGSRGSAIDFTGGLTAFMQVDPAGQLQRLELPDANILLSPLPR